MLRRSLEALLAAALAGLFGCRAARLTLTDWKVTGPDGQAITAATDDDLHSAWVSDGPQRAGMALTIDLGRRSTIHRVYLHPGVASHYPRGLRVSVGDGPEAMAAAVERQLPREVETDLCFNPAVGRYVELEIVGEGAGYPWSVAELRLFGSADPKALVPRDCVVVDDDAPDLLKTAAEDLRYYVGELAGRPLPLVKPEDANRYPGTVYRVVAPPKFETYEQLIADPRFEHLQRVTVRKEGREVRFSGLSTRTVMDAVYVFLEKQGVRWVCPGPMGDYVPRTGVNLGLLPIDEEPSFAVRHANFGVARYRGHSGYRWFLRTHWNLSWGNVLAENPGLPAPAKRPSFGFPHSFNSLVPAEMFKEHPEWFPLLRDEKWAERVGKENLGKRIPYGTTYGMNFCTSAPGVADYVAKRILDSCDPKTLHDVAWVIPMDASCWCECDGCCALDDPEQFERRTRYEVAKSNRHFAFIRQVADRVRPCAPNLTIGTLAYECYHQPPSRIDKLPDNVAIDFLWYGNYNLPLTTSKENAWLKERLDRWAQVWSRKAAHHIYDWALLLPDKNPMPIPLVTALADKVAYAHRLGVRNMGTQGSEAESVWRQNPWNYYAYARLNWNADEPAARILREFFTGYYQEAAEPMLRYYKTIEDHLIQNDIGLGDNLHYAITPGSFPLHVVKQMGACLDEAERRARQWFVKERVADARRGLDWVIDRQGLKLGDATFPSVPTDGRPLVLKATEVSIHTVGGEMGGMWNLWHYGRLGEHVRFERAGDYAMTVVAKADLFKEVGAQMVVHVGPRRFGPVTVASKEPKEYSVAVTAPEGVWEVAVEFVSDGVSGDRNLYIGELRLAAARP